MKLIRINPINNLDYLNIEWFLGKRCNFDCTYCTPDLHDNFSQHIPLEHLKNSTTSFLKSFSSDNIRIGFTGGEPTVHPEFHVFAKWLKSIGITNTTVTTNFSRTSMYYIDLLKNIKNMTISQHFEFIENDVFLSKVYDVFKNKSQKNYVNVQVMVHSNFMDEVKSAVDFYKKNNINFTLRRIRTKNQKNIFYNNYTNSDLEWLLELDSKKKVEESNCEITYIEEGNIKIEKVHANTISTNELNHFQNWTCYAGIRNLYIDENGDIYRGNCRQGGLIGNVKDKTINLPKETVICQKHRCACISEIILEKYKNE